MKNVILLRLKDGTDIIGKLKGENDKGIDLDDVFVLYCRYGGPSGSPEIYMTKYSIYNISFDVFFKREEIAHIFRDPMNFIIEYYENAIEKHRAFYNDMTSSKMKKQNENDFAEMISKMLKSIDDDTVH